MWLFFLTLGNDIYQLQHGQLEWYLVKSMFMEKVYTEYALKTNVIRLFIMLTILLL